MWTAVTGGKARGVELHKTTIGKPCQGTYSFAERRLLAHRRDLLGRDARPLRSVYMLGDNPESDIRGANQFKSENGSEWVSLLVKSGVFRGGEPSWKPREIVEDVWDGVQWALRRSGWKAPDP